MTRYRDGPAGYMFLKDLGFCAGFDLSQMADHPFFPEIEALHAEVRGWVESEDELAA